VAETRIVDYYAVLAVPPTADLMGIENAYAHLSDELATRVTVDDTSRSALFRLNEAYKVLSKPELRTEYDHVYFSKDIAVAEAVMRTEARKKRWMANTLVGALGLVVLVQAVALAYIGRDQLQPLVDVVIGPLLPGDAG
jgi:hypothetical protein